MTSNGPTRCFYGLAFAMLLLADAGTSAAATPQLSFPGFIGVQMRRGPQNHLFVEARINGHPATLLVDTGSDISFVSADRAEHFGLLTPAGDVQRRGRSFRLIAVGDMTLGGLSLGPTDVALAPASQFRGTAPGGRVTDGLIGLDLLRRRHALINCRTRQMFLKTNAAARIDLVPTTRALGFKRIPLELTRRAAFTVPCQVGERPGRLLVDTGAFVTGFDDDALRTIGIPTRPSGLTTRGFDGEVRPLELAQIDRLLIAGVAIKPQTFAVMDLYGKKEPERAFTGINSILFYAPRSSSQQILGVLGNELLDQLHAIIDVADSYLFLKPPGKR